MVNNEKKVVGVIYAKDLLAKKRGDIAKLKRPVIYVRCTDLISGVLAKMKNKRMHLAVVVNKNKKHVGIVTLEDILEELVGEIYDESHKLKRKKQKLK